MVRLIEFLEDKIIDSRLFEMVFSRREVESKITELSFPVVEHLIKILKWDDRLNYQKHCSDINNWLLKIKSYKMKNGKRPKQSDYYQWMFHDTVQDEKTISHWVKVLTNYHTLKIIRTDKEVFDSITNILFELSKDLSKDDIKLIQDYL